MAKTRQTRSARRKRLDPEVILLQVVAAVGQGAGALSVGYEAAEYLRQTYLQAIGEKADRWEDIQVLAFEWARGAGQQAAWLASRAGTFEISATHLSLGIQRLASSRTRGDCPFC